MEYLNLGGKFYTTQFSGQLVSPSVLFFFLNELMFLNDV